MLGCPTSSSTLGFMEFCIHTFFKEYFNTTSLFLFMSNKEIKVLRNFRNYGYVYLFNVQALEGSCKSS